MSTTTSTGPAIGLGISARCNTSGSPCFSNSTAFMFFLPLLLPLQKFDQQLAHPFRLFLLHPMPGAVDQMTAHHPRAGALLHSLEIAGTLVCSPVAFSRNEHGRNIDGAAGKQLKLGVIEALRPGPIPLQSALETSPLVFGAVDAKLAVGQPSASRDLGWRRHLG